MNDFDINQLFNKPLISKGFKTLLNQQTIKDLSLALGITLGQSTSLNKKELIKYFSENMEVFIRIVLESFTREMFDFVKLLIENGGEIEYQDKFAPNLIILLKMHLIAFPVTKNDVKLIVMPNDVYNILKSCDIIDLEKSVKFNELITTYTRRLVECYGFFEMDLIFNYLNKYEGYDLNKDDYFHLLNNDGFIYGYDIRNNHIFDYQVEEIPNFFEKRLKNDELDYYHLTKKQIIEGFDLSEIEKDILYLYENDLEMSEKMAQHGLLLLKELIKFEYGLDEINKLLKNFDILPFQLKKLEKLVESLFNNTRLWTLKGNTRNEIKIPKLIKFEKRK